MEWNYQVKQKRVNLSLISVFIVILTTVVTCIASDSVQVLPLSGNDWWIHDDPNSAGASNGFYSASIPGPGWIQAQVPGNIQADVEAAHLVEPLWYGAANPNLYEVARKDWWYRKDFVVPATYAGSRITLVFDGVDEHCKVWLNGTLIGENGGMFRRILIDVSKVVVPGQTNRLAVQINRMPEELVPFLIDSDGPDSGGGPSEPHWFVYGINKTREVLKDLKAPGIWSYDWSANVWTLGIWRDVHLESTGPVRIEWTRVETTLDDDYTQAVANPSPQCAGVVTVSKGNNSFSSATVHATLEVDSLTDGPAQVSFRVHGKNVDVSKVIDANLTKGINFIKAELLIDRPALWWPNGQGDQPLYTLDAEIKQADGEPVSDKSSTRFGVRQARWVHTDTTSPEIYYEKGHYTRAEYEASNYQLLINGRPVRGFGSAITLPYILPGNGHAHNLQLLHLAKNLGMNMIRINGGGGPLYNDAWFDLADELGIMVLYEYPAGNSVMEDDPVFMANLDATCRNLVKQTRNHPSIVQYAGGNEMGWARSQDIPALQLMQRIAAEESDLLFRATDPEPDNKHGPYWFDILQSKDSYGDRDGHYAFDGLKPRNAYIYYSGSDSDTMWYGEFGTTSPANLEVWHREIPLQSQWPLDDTFNDEALIYHNAARAVGGESWLFKSRIDATFGYLDNLPDLVAAGQYYGAEGLRYIYDALRRKGNRIGGMTNHMYSEAWPNAAGSYMVDYDGRTLMNYDFLKQALAPISLSVQIDSCLYSPDKGKDVELFLVSDAPKEATGLQAKWVARDREGTVLNHGEITSLIIPQEVKSLGKITLSPPAKTIGGPILMELRLEDSAGKLLVERVHIFGPADLPAPFAGLLQNRVASKASEKKVTETLPNGADNLAFVGNGAKPATASSALTVPNHQPVGLNDGIYGNDHSWIGETPRSSFQIDLAKPAMIGQFKLGRDRTGGFSDRPVDYLKIETSLDGQAWQTAFEQSGLTTLKGSNPTRSMLVFVAPVHAQFIRATVDSSAIISKGDCACVDEFEVYAPAKELLAQLPQVQFQKPENKIYPVYPVRRTTLKVVDTDVRMDGDQEVYALTVKNTGSMTALFCEPHPLLVYRTDLFINNNNCFIPAGESRVITISSPIKSQSALSLTQTGWSISCWNAADVTIAPNTDVILSVGRWDKMCREFAGYFDVNQVKVDMNTTCSGTRSDAGKLQYSLSGTGIARFEFDCTRAQLKRPAVLRIHTSDQSKVTPTVVVVTINGRMMEKTLPQGLGIQHTDPSHRAFPATVEFELAGSELRKGKNTLTVSIKGDGWFSWDSLDLVEKK